MIQFVKFVQFVDNDYTNEPDGFPRLAEALGNVGKTKVEVLQVIKGDPLPSY